MMKRSGNCFLVSGLLKPGPNGLHALIFRSQWDIIG